MNSTEKPQGQLVTLVSVPTEVEARPIVAALKAAGISTTMTGEFTAGFIAEAPGEIAIKIFSKDVKVAKKLLEKFDLENDAIDWSKVDVGKPVDE
jgi:hypothetical protein